MRREQLESFFVYRTKLAPLFAFRRENGFSVIDVFHFDKIKADFFVRVSDVMRGLVRNIAQLGRKAIVSKTRACHEKAQKSTKQEFTNAVSSFGVSGAFSWLIFFVLKAISKCRGLCVRVSKRERREDCYRTLVRMI